MNDYHRYRLYEILPGLSVWLTLFLALVLSAIRPLWMIYFIILFDIYWMLRVLNYSFYLVISWRRFSVAKKIDWQKKMIQDAPGWQEKQHVVFLTLLNEEWRVVETAMQSICQATYDKEKFVIVIAGEARRQDNFELIFQKIKEKFSGCFADIVGTLHRLDEETEVAGKGSNLHFSEKQIAKYIEKRGWKHDDVIVTIFDIDTVCHSQYFSYLTYLYCTHSRPTHSSFQPIALYNNNMWESPAVLRIMAFGTTFWMMTTLARQDSLLTFSSHSLSWCALLKAGFHDKRIVSEDSRIFYQCLIVNNGDYEVTPMYIPVSMDTVRDDNWWQSMKNLYKQQRRWAWGVEHVPYLMWEFRKAGKKISWLTKAKWLFIEWEGKWSWCLVALIITFLGRLPLYLAPETVRQSAFFFNAPHVLSNLMTAALLGLLLSALLSLPLLPKRPESHSRHNYLFMVAQWLLLPVSMIFFSALPALDAITHLMFGKYLGFNISQKKRVHFLPGHYVAKT